MAAATTPQNGTQTTTQEATGPRGLPIVGSLYAARKDPLGFLQGAWRDHGDYARLRFGPYRYLFVNEAEGVKHVLVDNNKNYRKSRSYDGLRLFLGEGLLTSEGDFWRRQRRLAQPAFHKERLANFAKVMAMDTASMLERWSAIPAGQAFDVHHEMMRLTLRIVARTLFSTDVDGEAEEVGRALTYAIRYANEYADSLMRLPTWIPSPKNLRFQRASKTLDALVLRIIEERRRTGEDAGDLLSLLMAAKDEDTREQMTDRQLRDEVMTIVMAGHETTANSLTWTFYLLSKHPAIARRLAREVQEVLGGRTPGLADLPRLTYTRMVAEESLRLYPPAWIFEREAIAADEVCGHKVDPGTIIGICPYVIHRNPRYWENPEGFDPDRFAPEHAASRGKFEYIPFGGGPRLCIGNAFAIMEMQIILAMVVAHSSLDLVPGRPVEVEPSVTLRPKDGVYVQRR